jgi:hypothetical protein
MKTSYGTYGINKITEGSSQLLSQRKDRLPQTKGKDSPHRKLSPNRPVGYPVGLLIAIRDKYIRFMSSEDKTPQLKRK